MNRGIISLIAIVVCAFTLNAQSLTSQVITTSGAEFENNGYYLSFTTAELASSELLVNGIMLTQGFQQGFLKRSSDYSPYSGDLAVYPNPATDHVKLVVGFNEPGSITAELYDMLGRKLIARSLESNSGAQTIELNVSDLAKGMYIVRLDYTNNNGDLHTKTSKVHIANR